MNTTTKILAALLLLSGLAVGVLTMHSQNLTERNAALQADNAALQADNAAKASALSAIRTQLQADALADSLAHSEFYARPPSPAELIANRKTLPAEVRPTVSADANTLKDKGKSYGRNLETPPAEVRPTVTAAPIVMLYKGEPFPYDSGVAYAYEQHNYIQRVSGRQRATEIAVGSRLPDVVLPDFMPTRKEVGRGKWRAFVGGLAVGAVAAIALPLALTR